MTIVAVADTGPLIHLAEIDALGLFTLVDCLYLPTIVYEELERGGLPASLSEIDYEVVEADVDSIDDDELDPGETAALAVATARDALFLTDDLDARERATEWGIEVHGSIGVIALGYARGQLGRDEAVSLVRALQRETSLYVTDAVVERGVAMLADLD